jgi:hypothetical protein
MFSFRDRLFETQFVPQPDQSLKFGLIDRYMRDYQSFLGLDNLPLKEMRRYVIRRVQRHPTMLVRPKDRSP